MSAGIDKEFIRDFYQRLTDKELLQTLNGNLRGLTQEAREVISEEVQRRNLDFDVSSIPPPQEEEDNYKVYDPNGCPVKEVERIWIERSFLTLLTFFGEENTLTRQVLLPVTKDFPIKYDGSERAAFETLKVIARQMEVPIDRIQLDFFDEQLRSITDGSPGGFYYGKGENDKFEISIVRTLLDEPEDMVAVLAHETAHIKLLGENRITENNEPLTDQSCMFTTMRTETGSFIPDWSQK
jgi:Peptidase family M48